MNILSVQHNLKRVINASGRMSILGVSNLEEPVIKAMKEGASQYYIMEQLHEEAGKYIASKLNTEAAYVINSASAGIVLAVAGVITRGDKWKENNILNHRVDLKRDILLMKGHNVDYGAPVGTMIAHGGGIIREVGYANGCSLDEIEAAITNETAGIIFVQSHHCVQKNMPQVAEVYQIAQKHKIPLIVDAAAEEDLQVYSQVSDLVIFSGSKAIEGPTSGVLAGKKDFISYVKGHHYGIGRSMKIGKESIIGLVKAIEVYEQDRVKKEEQLRRLEPLNELNKIRGIELSIEQDPAGREIYRGKIIVDEEQVGLSALQLVDEMKHGDIAIFTRDYHASNGSFEVDPRPLKNDDCYLIVQRIKEIIHKL